jgi:hypothetical protein
VSHAIIAFRPNCRGAGSAREDALLADFEADGIAVLRDEMKSVMAGGTVGWQDNAYGPDLASP